MTSATNPETKSENAKSLVRISKPVQLYDQGEPSLGLILRPVRRVINTEAIATSINNAKKVGASTQTDTTANQQGNRGEEESNEAVKKISEAIRASLVSQKQVREQTSVRPESEDEYGPLISMPLPEKIKDSLRVSYSTSDLGMAAVGATFGQNLAESNKSGPGLTNALVGSASYVIRTLVAALPGGVGALGQKLSNSIPNPFSAAIFEKVNPRKFSFNWTIQPQTPEESERLKEVINNLRYWSLPNPSKDGLILGVPYEWELSFVGTNFLYSFSRCFMSSIDIDYSPNGFNAFMADGAPQAVTISLEFEEIFPLDKRTIDEAGPGSQNMKPKYGTETREESAAPASTSTQPTGTPSASVTSLQLTLKQAEERVKNLENSAVYQGDPRAAATTSANALAEAKRARDSARANLAAKLASESGPPPPPGG